MEAWQKTTGIKARRLFSYSDDPEIEKVSTQERWLKARAQGIGGSDIGAIAGVNPFRSAIHVFLEKTGRLKTEDNEKMKWGRILEGPVANEYAEKQGVCVQRVNACLQHPDHKIALVNLDRLIVKNGGSNNTGAQQCLSELGNGCLEVKTTSWAKAWADGVIPDYYYTQLQWELGVTGLLWGQFAVLVSGQEMIIPAICKFHPNVFDKLVVLAERFWTDHVVKDIAPEPDQNPATLDAMKILYPEIEEKTVSLEEDIEKLIDKRQELSASIKVAEAKRKAIDANVLAKLGNAKYGITERYKVTRVLRTSVRFRRKEFQEDYPELASKYMASSESLYPLYRSLKEKF